MPLYLSCEYLEIQALLTDVLGLPPYKLKSFNRFYHWEYHTGKMELLLRKDASIEAITTKNNNNTPLDYAIREG